MSRFNKNPFCAVIFLVCFIGFPSKGQNAYDEFLSAEELYKEGKAEDALNLLENAYSVLDIYPEKMSFAQAEKFFDLYASLTYELGKMSTIDSVYLAGIKYGDLITNDTLSCKYINLRGNFWRIKNQWSMAIDILKTGLNKSCTSYDYIQIHALLGKCYAQLNFDSVQYYTMKVLPLAEQTKDTANLMLLYNNLVSYYKKSNRKAQAFEYEKKSLEYEGAYPVMQVGSNLSIAGLLTSMNHLSLAEEYIHNAESIVADKEDRRTNAQITYYKARLEFARKNYEKALQYIQESLDYFLEKNYTNQIAAALSDKAIFAKQKGDTLLYVQSIKELEAMLESIKSTTFKYAASSPIAKYYLDANNPAKAKSIMNALDISLEQIDWMDRDDYLEIKAEIAKQERNYPISIGYFEQLNEYRDSMQKANTINQLFLSEQQYDRNKKNKEINKLAIEAELAKAQLNTSRRITAIALISLAFLSFFIYLLYRKNNKIIEQQKRLNTALSDKDILLREIHHRVKNNLQVVSSLLNLQSNYISDNVALAAINEGKNRVSSMALIHQNLYQENNLTSINSKEYFDNLIENLFDSYNIEEENIDLSKDIDDLDIDVDTMIPLGLIVNELVSNALKHAFKGNHQKGHLSVRLKEENNVLNLSISDNGVGMSENHFLSSDSFGNKMIRAFLQKLNAEIKVINDNGTSVSLQIKNYKLKAA
jgi:two-component sensor histidine kinase